MRSPSPTPGYAGWNFVNSISNTLSGQGVNVLMNIFFGPAVNAARGLSNTVQRSVAMFVNNFTIALTPQITKAYANKDMDYVKYLTYRGSRFAFYILFIISLPVILEADFVFNLWLKEVPKYTVDFNRLAMISNLIGLFFTIFINVEFNKTVDLLLDHIGSILYSGLSVQVVVHVENVLGLGSNLIELDVVLTVLAVEAAVAALAVAADARVEVAALLAEAVDQQGHGGAEHEEAAGRLGDDADLIALRDDADAARDHLVVFCCRSMATTPINCLLRS